MYLCSFKLAKVLFITVVNDLELFSSLICVV